MRSVMMPSTPRSSNSCIAAGSSIVQTCTCMPSRCACRTNRLSTTRTLAYRSGTWTAATPGTKPASPRPCREPSRSAATSRCAHRGRLARPAHPARPADAPVAERGEQHPVARARLPDRLDGRVDRRVGLHVHVHPALRPGVEDVGQAGHHPVALAADRGQVGPGQVLDPAGPPEQPVERVVVEDHRHPVAGRVHVGLEVGYPASTARAKASIEFSSPSAAPPRWAKASGSGASRYGYLWATAQYRDIDHRGSIGGRYRMGLPGALVTRAGADGARGRC